jgi:hypothetical protein
LACPRSLRKRVANVRPETDASSLQPGREQVRHGHRRRTLLFVGGQLERAGAIAPQSDVQPIRVARNQTRNPKHETRHAGCRQYREQRFDGHAQGVPLVTRGGGARLYFCRM